jgi:hypothetical protein
MDILERSRVYWSSFTHAGLLVGLLGFLRGIDV